MSGIDHMTLWWEFDQYVSYSIQKDISLGLTGCENSFQLLFHWWYCVMPFYALLFVPGSKWWNQLFSVIMTCEESWCLWRHTIPAIVKKYIFFLSLCSSISSSGIHWAQVFWYSKLRTVSLDHSVPYPNFCCHILHCYISVFSSQLIDFSSLSIGRGRWQATAAGLLASACATVFEMLYTSTDNSSAHASISTCMLKLCVNIGYGNFITSHCWNYTCLPAIFSCWNMIMWWGRENIAFIVVSGNRWN